MVIEELTGILKENNLFTPKYLYIVHWARTSGSITVKKVSEALNISERAAKLHIDRLEALELLETGKLEKKKRVKLNQMQKPQEDAALSVRFTYYVWDCLKKANPTNLDIEKAFFDVWEKELRLLIEERKNIKEVTKVFQFALEDDFWKTVILSASNFRKKYDKIKTKMSATVEDKKPQITVSKSYLSDD